MDYIFSVRSIRRGDFVAEPGATHFLAVPETADDPKPEHAIRKTLWFDQVFQAARHGPQNDGARGDVLFYVHGFNTENSVMLERLRLLRRSLEAKGFEGVVVAFDWPAATSALNYLEDRVDAKSTAFRLVSEGIANFARMQRPDCFVNLHILAHSTGAYVVREAFDDADDRPGVAASSWSVSQVMLVSADISAGGMAAGHSKSSSLYRHCVRLTNYSNPLDRVLSLSDVKRIGVAPRVGRVGLPRDHPSKAVEVNCGAHFAAVRDRYDHLSYPEHTFWFFDDVVLEDVLHTMRGEVDRNQIVTRVATADGLSLARQPA